MARKQELFLRVSMGLTCAVALGCLSVCPGCGTVGPPANGCTTDADCDDGVACTVDTCGADGVCVHDPISCPEGQAIDLGTAPDDLVAALDVQSEITAITIDSPPVVEFTVTTANGTPITGIGALWEDSDRYVRFTITKAGAGDQR